jgi:hypothetical protein
LGSSHQRFKIALREEAKTILQQFGNSHCLLLIPGLTKKGDESVSDTSINNSNFELLIQGSGRINDVSFDLEGTGQGSTVTGRFSFNTTFTDVAKGTDPFANVLGALIILTGAFGREAEGASNLITLADGVFGFTQLISGEGIDVSTVGDLSRTSETQFTWKSRAEGKVSLKKVSSIEPFDVVMLPQGMGKLIEVIALPLIDQRKRKIVNLVRDFTFNPKSQLSRLQLRHVTVTPRVTGRTVSVDTNSTIQVFPSSIAAQPYIEK